LVVCDISIDNTPKPLAKETYQLAFVNSDFSSGTK